jgi:pimeloyl-ACP methyl ester carboxylesterase
MKFYPGVILLLLICNICTAQSGNDTIVLRDIQWDKSSPASQIELAIPSGKSLMQGFMYKANGKQKHPTLLLLSGYPGNERNLDLAQVVRAHGWNVVYFNYRGSWGSQGNFSFENCVEDVINVVGFCKEHRDSLQIDTANIVLFGHSMGGWVCLKALQKLPGVKKGFVLSAWDIYADYKNVKSEKQMLALAKNPHTGGDYFVLNTPVKEIYERVLKRPDYFNLLNVAKALADKQIIMLDEHPSNKPIADAIRKENKSYFDYQVWQTDHAFTNKRVALIKLVLTFLDK